MLGRLWYDLFSCIDLQAGEGPQSFGQTGGASPLLHVSQVECTCNVVLQPRRIGREGTRYQCLHPPLRCKPATTGHHRAGRQGRRNPHASHGRATSPAANCSKTEGAGLKPAADSTGPTRFTPEWVCQSPSCSDLVATPVATTGCPATATAGCQATTSSSSRALSRNADQSTSNKLADVTTTSRLPRSLK